MNNNLNNRDSSFTAETSFPASASNISQNMLFKLSAFMVLVLMLMMNSTASRADLKATFNAFAWDESADRYENSNVTINPNGNFLPFVHRLSFDNDLTANSAKCATLPPFSSDSPHMTKWGGTMEFGLYHRDTGVTAPAAPNGFLSTEDWRIAHCDRNNDGKYGIKDLRPLANAVLASPSCDTAPQTGSYSVSSEGYCQYASTSTDTISPVPPNTSNVDDSIVLISKDVESSVGCGGNCETEIVTTLGISLDKDCDGDLDADIPLSNVGLPLMCFFARAEKPNLDTWTGNIQTRITEGGGDKTVNFNLDVTEASVSSFEALIDSGKVRLDWETTSQVGTFGFHIERQDLSNGEFVRVNSEILLAEIYAPHGAIYQFIDPDASLGQPYTYRLVEVEFRGRNVVHGPYPVTATNLISPNSIVTDYAPGFKRKKKGMTQRSQNRNKRSSQNRKNKNTRVATGARVLEPANGSSGITPRLKIKLSEEGIYSLPIANIANDFGISGHKLQRLISEGELLLINQNQPVAWIQKNNEILFYGQAIDSENTNTNVYWLEIANGVTMEKSGAKKPKHATPGAAFLSTGIYEEDLTPMPFIFDDPDDDFWLWDNIYATASISGAGPSGGQFTFETPDVDTAGNASLVVNLKGAVDLVVEAEHHAHVYINGTEVGETVFDGKSTETLAIPFDANLLNDGENILKIEAELAAGTVASFWLQDFTVSYNRYYQAVDNVLNFSDGDNKEIKVGGFSSDQIIVLEISDARNPVYLSNKSTKISQSVTGYSVSFRTKANSNYYAATSDKIMSPSMEPDDPSNLKSSSNAADYIVIAPTALATGAQELVNYRSASYSTDLVDLENIYDEFSAGIVDPYAIRDFIAYANDNWSMDLKFVTLAGQGTQDHKNRLGLDASILPLLLTSTPFGLFASDRRFEAPGVIIGRIPALSSAELSNYVLKVKDYENSAGESWTRNALFLADNPGLAGDFHADSNAVAALLPSNFPTDKIYFSSGDSPTATNHDVVTAINNGIGFFNYVGHSGTADLGDEKFLSISRSPSDADLLTNNGQTPIFSAMTCAVGNGTYPGYDSLVTEMLMKSNGGFIAAFAPTGLSWNNVAHELNLALVDAIYGTAPASTMGDAVSSTLDSLGGNEFETVMKNIYHLFGDPAIKPNY